MNTQLSHEFVCNWGFEDIRITQKKIGVLSVNGDSHLFTNDVELVSFCMEYQ